MPLMKTLRLTRSICLALCLFGFAACSTRQEDLASLTPDDLYTRAMVAYEARDYGKAIPVLEAFVQQHLGDPRAPEALMNLGRAHMARRDYLTAATYFQRLVEDFPSTPFNLEARAAICSAYVLLSPRPQLDQEYTHAALAHCQSVAVNYATTPEGQESARRVAELHEKLAAKTYQNGLFYLRRRAYDSAVIYFNDVLEDYPDTSYASAALGKLVETYGIIGYVEEVQQTRERLLRDFPNSPEALALPADTATAAQ